MKYCDNILRSIDERLENSRRAKEVRKAVKLLRPLFNGFTESRNKTIDVFATIDNVKGDFIIVRIDGTQYDINVTGECIQSIVRSVVDRVILKI